MILFTCINDRDRLQDQKLCFFVCVSDEYKQDLGCKGCNLSSNNKGVALIASWQKMF